MYWCAITIGVPGEAKVCDLNDLVLPDEAVTSGEVAVDEAAWLQVLHARTHLQGDIGGRYSVCFLLDVYTRTHLQGDIGGRYSVCFLLDVYTRTHLQGDSVGRYSVCFLLDVYRYSMPAHTCRGTVVGDTVYVSY